LIFGSFAVIGGGCTGLIFHEIFSKSYPSKSQGVKRANRRARVDDQENI
jgi:hypothetical protein